jgi:ATP-dependent exoDNAse (exonuclease V) beta subunit
MAQSQKHDPKRPDLLLETDDGTWYLIDYKTDHFSVADIEQQASRHRPQLERYGEDFTALTGITPKLAIYFAQHGILHQLAKSSVKAASR